MTIEMGIIQHVFIGNTATLIISVACPGKIIFFGTGIGALVYVYNFFCPDEIETVT
jgi:hypothetical protein